MLKKNSSENFDFIKNLYIYTGHNRLYIYEANFDE